MNYEGLRELLGEYCNIMYKIEHGNQSEIQENDFDRVEVHNKIINYLGLKDKEKITELETLFHNFPTRKDGYSFAYDITEALNIIYNKIIYKEK